MVASGSTALTMSCSVSPATETAVSASISTPVRPVVLAVAVTPMVPAPESRSNSTVTEVSASWWHSGISSLVRLAAPMPASRAVARTSAFFSGGVVTVFSPAGSPDPPRGAAAAPPGRLSAATMRTTSGRVRKTPSATAMRRVSDLSPTSTIRTRPSGSRCVRPPGFSGAPGRSPMSLMAPR